MTDIAFFIIFIVGAAGLKPTLAAVRQGTCPIANPTTQRSLVDRQ